MYITIGLTDQDRTRLISQLINGISRVFRKVLKYFNITIISTFFVPPFPVCPAICCLNLNELLLLLLSGKSIISSYYLELVISIALLQTS